MSRNSQRGGSHIALAIIAAFVAVALVIAAIIVWPRVSQRLQQPDGTNVAHSDTDAAPSHDELPRDQSPTPDTSNEAKARRAVAAMSMDERVGQLVMAPLYAGTDPSALWDLIANQHVGSVLIIGNWNDGVSSVRAATDALQSYAPQSNRLLMTTDQEGGLVQHLQGPGFDAMPSAVEQGMMGVDQLRQSAAVWGSQLAQAGINVDLAPVLGTVTIDRMANEPVGMLYRDFGLDADGNAQHGIAFIQGMRDVGVATSVKHYPGLGSVNGNTDFTADGILDTTTTLDGVEIGAFDTAITQSDPGMVMMSLATYQAIDPNNPAVFSSAIVDQHLRGTVGYEGVVTSDSLSAAALGGYSPDQLGVRLVDAGGDLACVGVLDYVQPILDGLRQRTASDPQFADKVTRSAQRVMTLKYEMGLATEG